MADNGETHTGICSDIDGTLYRQGSVFVEVLASLAVQSTLFDPAARSRLREAVGTVGAFYGGSFARWRWEQALRGVAELRRRSSAETAARTLDVLRTVRERLDGVVPEADSRADPVARAAFQRRLLTQYGEAIDGQDRAALSRAVRSTLRDVQPIDRRTGAALARLTGGGAEVALVTDMPSHVAEAFAHTVVDCPVASVRGTTFRTDDSGTFTGDYEPIEKGAVVETLVGTQNWEYTLAAGDTDRDAAMAPHVDTFLAVAGHGGAQRAAEALGSEQTVQYVDPGDALGDALIERCPVG